MEPSQIQARKPYYYTITGDVVQGDNKEDKLFQKDQGKFPLNVRGGILNQSKGWNTIEGEITPTYQNAPGTVPAEFAMHKSIPSPENA